MPVFFTLIMDNLKERGRLKMEKILEVFKDLASIGGGITAIVLLINYFLKKPIVYIGRKGRARMKELIREEMSEIREYVEVERENLDQKIEEVKTIYDNNLKVVERVIQNIVKKEILEIYRNNRDIRALSETDREDLDDLFMDYANRDGNGDYIAKVYHRMTKWPIKKEDNV